MRRINDKNKDGESGRMIRCCAQTKLDNMPAVSEVPKALPAESHHPDLAPEVLTPTTRGNIIKN